MEFRLYQLRRLCSFLVEEEPALLAALEKDFKSHFEALAELHAVQTEVIKAIDNLSKWIKPAKVSQPWAYYLDTCRMEYQPRGTILVIGAWNYPVDLILEPLIGAIAAGCTAILKPSEVAVNTAKCLTDLLPKYLDQECYIIVNGGPQETGQLLDWPKWDLIFYTGNSNVGRIIQTKAASNLIPTVLELGGKSPCIVTSRVDVDTVARRLMYGKLFNAGQTCVAPDYVITFPEMLEPLKEAIIGTVKVFYGENPIKSTDYSRIINHKHYDRLSQLLANLTRETEIISIGDSDREDKYFAPTVVLNPPIQSTLMLHEIFGPILPIITVETIDEAISFITGRDKPLALYLFSNNVEEIEKVLKTTSSGSVCINDTMMQVFSGIFPLGGIGPSGMGRYKGQYSFETFSHAKPVMWRGQSAEWINTRVRHPPVEEGKYRLLSKIAFSKPRHYHLAPSSAQWQQ